MLLEIDAFVLALDVATVVCGAVDVVAVVVTDAFDAVVVFTTPIFFNEPIDPLSKSGLSTSGPPNS